MNIEDTRKAAEKELLRRTEQIDALDEWKKELICKREKFIEENSYLFAPFKIGQKLINKNNLKFGIVSGYYHYGNKSYFTIYCDIDICDDQWNLTGFVDNTSRRSYNKFELPWVDFEEYKRDSENKIELKIKEEI